MYFSCIITCFNREHSIIQAIDSILAQKHKFFEIIVVDDASTDNSVELIKALYDEKITVVEHKYNRGQNAALNSGVKVAKYDYLAFLDSDDTWLNTYLSEMQQAYRDNPDIAFAYCSLVNGPLWKLEGIHKYGDVLDQGFLSSMITITAKKDAVMQIGGFDPRYTICQDDDFCFRLSSRYSFKAINKHLSVIHGAPNSMTLHLQNVARGWEFLFTNYKHDILKYCGSKTYSKHMARVAYHFFVCNDLKNGITYFFKSFYYLLLKRSENKFTFGFRDFFDITLEIIKYKVNHLRRRLASKAKK